MDEEMNEAKYVQKKKRKIKKKVNFYPSDHNEDEDGQIDFNVMSQQPKVKVPPLKLPPRHPQSQNLMEPNATKVGVDLHRRISSRAYENSSVENYNRYYKDPPKVQAEKNQTSDEN